MNFQHGGSVQSRIMQDPKSKSKAPQTGTTGSAKVAFNFGSGRENFSAVKATRCIIQRSQMQPALLGRRAQSLVRPISF
jgi:hypothetical protein